MFKKAILFLGVMLTLATQSVYAALPASVATTVTAIQTDAKDVFDLVFPVIGIIIGMTILIKLFKRFSNKV